MSERRKIRRLIGDVKEEYGDRVADYAKDYGRWYVRHLSDPIGSLKEPIPPIPGHRTGARGDAEHRRRVEELKASRKAPPQPDQEHVEAIEIQHYEFGAIEPADDE